MSFIPFHVTGGAVYLDALDYFFIVLFLTGIAVLGFETRSKIHTKYLAPLGLIALSFSGLVYSFILLPTLPQIPPPANAVYVDMLSQSFSPGTIKVVMGVNDTVAWRNVDTVTHGPHADNNLFYLVVQAGQVKWYTFTHTGQYPYHCHLHPLAQGVVNIVA